MKTINYLFIALTSLFIFSCVSSRKFNDMQSRLNQENSRLTREQMELTTRHTELQATAQQLQSKNQELAGQVDLLSRAQESLTRQLETIQKEKKEIERQLETLKTGSSAEIEKLLAELDQTRGNLNQREDKLRDAEKALHERNARLVELQDALRLKDEAVKQLKSKVMDALVGFQNNGLTVFEKNGKVYVSLEERLLFKTGQWEVDPKGQQALRDLATVLGQNPDINVMVEGHTDDVPMRGTGQVKDNWDLSVMRATAVTKILLQNKQIDPVRIVSAGRGEYLPVAVGKTAEDRQKNRRTEIILTPKLDELFKLLETN